MRRGLAAAAVVGLLAALAVRAAAQDQPPQVAPSPPTPAPQLPPPADANVTAAEPPPEEAPPPEVRTAPVEKAAPAPPPKPPEPLKRMRHDAAVLQATDKITAATLRFEAKVGQPVRYKDLVITVRACETTATDEPIADSVASLEVQSQPATAVSRKSLQPREVYRGWMFANSPSLHPLEHPVYALTLIACRTASGGAPAGKP